MGWERIEGLWRGWMRVRLIFDLRYIYIWMYYLWVIGNCRRWVSGWRVIKGWRAYYSYIKRILDVSIQAEPHTLGPTAFLNKHSLKVYNRCLVL